jgi:hypothetical protein
MPALVKSKLGSFFTTIGAEGTMACPLDAKKSKNCCLISGLVIISLILGCIGLKSYICYAFLMSSKVRNWGFFMA